MLDDENINKKEELKCFFKKLGEAINNTLNSSNEVQDVINQIKKFGLGTDLSIIIGLGLYCQSENHQDGDNNQNNSKKNNCINTQGLIKFELTSEDKIFLEKNRLCMPIDF